MQFTQMQKSASQLNIGTKQITAATVESKCRLGDRALDKQLSTCIRKYIVANNIMFPVCLGTRVSEMLSAAVSLTVVCYSHFQFKQSRLTSAGELVIEKVRMLN